MDYADRMVRLRHLATGATGLLADDGVHSYRRDAERGNDAGYLILLAQPYVQGQSVTFRPVTRPGEALPVASNDVLAEAYLQTSLDCHAWKNAFLNIHGWELPTADGAAKDVWDALEAHWPSKHSDEEYQRYHGLFLAQIVGLRARLDRVMQLFHHVLPHDYQASIIRACRQLEGEREVYLHLPALLSRVPNADDDAMFRERFAAVGRVLCNLSREADHRRDLLRDAQPG